MCIQLVSLKIGMAFGGNPSQKGLSFAAMSALGCRFVSFGLKRVRILTFGRQTFTIYGLITISRSLKYTTEQSLLAST